jgi:hypothetical protein
VIGFLIGELPVRDPAAQAPDVRVQTHIRDFVQCLADEAGCAGVTAGTRARPVSVLRHRPFICGKYLLATCRIRTRPFVEGV